MQYRLRIILLVLCLAVLTPDLHGQVLRPNIVYIMLDDLGWADIGVNEGGTDVQTYITTPKIDTLASQGVNFKNYYTMGTRCSPTRASILTGLDPIRFGIDVGIGDPTHRGIPAHVRTLPQALSGPGIDYATWHVGKWHLGVQQDHHDPCGVGFERSVRLQTTDRVDPKIEYACNPQNIVTHTGRHSTRVLTDESIWLIHEHVTGGDTRPFFLSLWYWAPHTPLDPPAHVSSMPPTELEGEELNYLPEVCPDPGDGSDQRKSFDALVCFADSQIGRLVDYLETQGLMYNTLFIVTSDNGGTHQAWHGSNGYFRGAKTQTFEGGIRAPLIARWDAVLAAGANNYAPIYSYDWFPTLLELAGGDPSSEILDGRSIMDRSSGSPPLPSDSDIFWESRFSKEEYDSPSGIFNWGAVRRGDWKLVVEPLEGQPHVLHLFDIKNDPYETMNEAPNDPVRTTELFEDYLDWRREISEIPLTPVALGGAAITTDPAGNFEYAFDSLTPGLVELTDNELKDFSSFHFTFVADFLADDTTTKQHIASSSGAWKLQLKDGTLSLNISDDGTNTILQPPISITPGEWHRVAFTVRNWRGSRRTVSLYFDDEPLVEAYGTDTMFDSDVPVGIGAKHDLSFPFSGQMRNVSLHTMELYERQIR